MKVLKAADYKRMAWKNGGGETAEIAVFPAHAGLSDFDWRISMATVGESGPFSLFPDIDRTLSVIKGAGMELTVGEHPPHRLFSVSEPFAFPADVACEAQLLDGAITDLNVMTRRGRFAHHVERLSLPHIGKRVETLCLLFCQSGDIVLETEAGRFDLATFDCAMIPAETTILSVSGDGAALLIELRDV